MEMELFNKMNALAIIPLAPLVELSFLPPEICILKDTLIEKLSIIILAFGYVEFQAVSDRPEF